MKKILQKLTCLLILLPSQVFALGYGGTTTGDGGQLTVQPPGTAQEVLNIGDSVGADLGRAGNTTILGIKMFAGAIVLILTIVVVIGGVELSNSRGNPAKRQQAIQKIVYALLAAALLGGVYGGVFGVAFNILG